MQLTLPGIKKILIIRTDGIGDLLNSTPAIALLRQNYPDAEITVLARPLNAPVLHGNPDVDRILIFDGGGLRERIRFYQNLRRERFQLVVAMQTATWPHFVAFLTGARYRLGRYQKRFKSTLTHAWRGSYRKGETHEVDRNLELVRLICNGDGVRRLVFHLNPDEIGNAEVFLKTRLKTWGISADRFLIGIHPGGSSFDKRWPEKHYAELADRLARHYNAEVLILHGPDEMALAREIQETMQTRAVVYAPPSIRELAALLRCCNLVVCNDSGPMHLAAALAVPTVAIFGPTDHVAWHPLSEHASIVRRDMPCWPCSAHKCKIDWECTKKLPIEKVWNKIEEISPSFNA